MDKYKIAPSYILINGDQSDISTLHRIKPYRPNKFAQKIIFTIFCSLLFIFSLYHFLLKTPEKYISNDYSSLFGLRTNTNTRKSNIFLETPNNEISKLQAIQPVIGTITSGFGYRIHPTSKRLDFHPAVDIRAAENTPVHSILEGKVMETGTSKIFGKYIIINHFNNMQSKYCHCKKIIVRKGNTIKKGQIISNVGSTGMSTGPHLHLEIFIDKVNIDPLLILPPYNFEI